MESLREDCAVDEDGAGFRGGGDGDVVLHHLHRSVDENVEETGAFALTENDFTHGKTADRMIAKRGEKSGHGAASKPEASKKGKLFP